MRRPNGRGALGDRARHPAERDEAERLAHQPRDLQQRRAALRPAAGAHHLVLLDQPAEAGQQQHHGVVGDLLDEGVGDVGDGNAARGGGLDVDAVDADAAERDDLAVFEGVDDRLGDRHALGVDRIGGLCGGDEFRLVGRRLDDLGPDRVERFLLVIVAAAGDREARALRRHHPEFRHFLLPILFFGVGLRRRAPPLSFTRLLLLRDLAAAGYNRRLLPKSEAVSSGGFPLVFVTKR